MSIVYNIKDNSENVLEINRLLKNSLNLFYDTIKLITILKL